MQINGDMLRQLREAKRLSQEELGEAAGRTRVWIGMVERGEKEPGLDTLDKLARVFGKKDIQRIIVDSRDRATFSGHLWDS